MYKENIIFPKSQQAGRVWRFIDEMIRVAKYVEGRSIYGIIMGQPLIEKLNEASNAQWRYLDWISVSEDKAVSTYKGLPLFASSDEGLILLVFDDIGERNENKN